MTGALKIVYGTLSMQDGTSARRHYVDLGSQCARMWTEVRTPDLNILDCLWVSYGSTTVNGQPVSGCVGYPPSIVSRQNILLAGHDPVAIDYYANKHILLPLGGENAANHDPDRNPRLVSVYREAQDTLNAAGGIRGRKVKNGDENIELISASATSPAATQAWRTMENANPAATCVQHTQRSEEQQVGRALLLERRDRTNLNSHLRRIHALATVVCASALSLAGIGMSACGGAGTTVCSSCGTSTLPPAITLTMVGPYNETLGGQNWVVAGIPGFTLLATGTGFTSASIIQWNGSALPTQFGTSTGLAAQVTSAMVATPGTAVITVKDSGTTSSSLPFGIASPAAATAGVIAMITVAPDGTPANQNSLVAPAISGTGRYVSFQSAATNLDAGITSAYQQIYERDTCIGAPVGCTPSTIPISVTYDGSPVDGHSHTHP